MMSNHEININTDAEHEKLTPTIEFWLQPIIDLRQRRKSSPKCDIDGNS